MDRRNFFKILGGVIPLAIGVAAAHQRQNVVPPPILKVRGYRGDSFFDAGYVYAPYIPLYQTHIK